MPVGGVQPCGSLRSLWKSCWAQGSCIEDLVVAIVPAIAREVYQVWTQVGVEVGLTVYDSPEEGSDSELIETIMALKSSPLLPGLRAGASQTGRGARLTYCSWSDWD